MRARRVAQKSLTMLLPEAWSWNLLGSQGASPEPHRMPPPSRGFYRRAPSETATHAIYLCALGVPRGLAGAPPEAPRLCYIYTKTDFDMSFLKSPTLLHSPTRLLWLWSRRRWRLRRWRRKRWRRRHWRRKRWWQRRTRHRLCGRHRRHRGLTTCVPRTTTQCVHVYIYISYLFLYFYIYTSPLTK